MPVRNEIEHALQRATAYLDSRRCRDGGYCFYRTDYIEESSVHDTYHALAAWRLLGQPSPNRQATAGYLQDQPETSSQPYYLFYYVHALRLLGLPVADATVAAIDTLRIAAPADAESFAGWLDETLKVVRLKRAFRQHYLRQQVADFIGVFRRDGGYGAKPSLENTYLALCLFEAMEIPMQDDDTARFVGDMQTPELGFCNTRDSRYSNNRILHAGVGCCRLLGIPVRHPAAIMANVLASQTADGAFASVASSLPDLRSHYLALKIIGMLGNAPGVAATLTELTEEDVLD
jgi:hypothetical protein